MVRDKITGRVYLVYVPTDLNKEKPRDRIVFLEDWETSEVIHVHFAEYCSQRYEMLPPGSKNHA